MQLLNTLIWTTEYSWQLRRLRNAMWQTATDNSAEDDISAILLSGLSNVYTDYITTYEEYQQQGLDSMENIII